MSRRPIEISEKIATIRNMNPREIKRKKIKLICPACKKEWNTKECCGYGQDYNTQFGEVNY